MNLSPEQVRALRVRAQHLHQKASVRDLIEVVRTLGGVNAQLEPAMMLSLRARIKGLEPADVKAAIENHAVVRTWAMRGTIHLLDSNDLGWMVSLLGPAMIKKGGRRRLELGLDEGKVARGLNAIRTILSGRAPLDRDHLIDRLIDHGVDIERKSQVPYHLIARAAMEGLICIGPDNEDGEQTFALVDDWVGTQKPVPRDKALAELAYRYLNGYGPASPHDFASWSGLPMADAKKGWDILTDRGDLADVNVEDRKLWLLKERYEFSGEPATTGPMVNLLPAFDTYVLGYSYRESLVPGKYQEQVYHGGQTVPVVMVDGIAAGVWRYVRQGKNLKIEVSLFGRNNRTIRDLIVEETEDIGRFFGLKTSLAFHA